MKKIRPLTWLTVSVLFLATHIYGQPLPFQVPNSKICRLSCIDEGYTYCPTSVRIGNCNKLEKFLASQRVLRGCSSTNQDIGAKYLTCPKERWCTSSMKVADFTERVVAIKHRLFKGGYMCSYMFKFPLDARPGDLIEAKVTQIRALQVYSAIGKNLLVAKGRQVDLPQVKSGFQEFTDNSTFPDALFITLASTDPNKVSSFKIVYRVRPKLILEKIEQSGESGLFKLTKDGKFDYRLWILIGACAGGVLLIIIAIIICVVVYRTRKKQLAIVDVIKEYDHVKSQKTINSEMQKLAEEGASPEKLRLALEEFEKAMINGKDVEVMARQYAQVDFYGNAIEFNNPRIDKETSSSKLDYDVGVPLNQTTGSQINAPIIAQPSKVVPLIYTAAPNVQSNPVIVNTAGADTGILPQIVQAKGGFDLAGLEAIDEQENEQGTAKKTNSGRDLPQ